MGRDANGPSSNGRSGARVRLARFTLEDQAYGASRLPKQPKTTVLQSNTTALPAYFLYVERVVRIAKPKRNSKLGFGLVDYRSHNRGWTIPDYGSCRLLCVKHSLNHQFFAS